MTAGHPAARGGGMYRLALAATAPDPGERAACVAPARDVRAVAARHAGPDLLRAQFLLDADGSRLRIEVGDQAAALPPAVTGFGDDREGPHLRPGRSPCPVPQ
ncbi:hypothetical protein [Kitasatospora sp. NPDC091207]|uniref:hypothetical protein n=1 Tax=Kitasatospora sp. NPDC091207 TaxID=3364083 RepID=UPI00382597C7